MSKRGRSPPSQWYNAARDARRVVAAARAGCQIGKRGRRPASVDGPKGGCAAKRGSNNKTPAGHAVATIFIEVCAGRRSRVGASAKRCGAAVVRIVEPRDGEIVPAPEVVSGRAVNWPLNVNLEHERSRLAGFVRDQALRTNDLSRIVLLTSPKCTPFSSIQGLNRKRRLHSVIREERKSGMFVLYCMRQLHQIVRKHAKPGSYVLMHEQPRRAKAPKARHDMLDYANQEWPWAVRKGAPASATVYGCAVGLRLRPNKSSTRVLSSKAWVFEVEGSPALLELLRNFQCSGDHEHVVCQGTPLTRASENYPPMLGCLIAEAVCNS